MNEVRKTKQRCFTIDFLQWKYVTLIIHFIFAKYDCDQFVVYFFILVNKNINNDFLVISCTKLICLYIQILILKQEVEHFRVKSISMNGYISYTRFRRTRIECKWGVISGNCMKVKSFQFRFHFDFNSRNFKAKDIGISTNY